MRAVRSSLQAEDRLVGLSLVLTLAGVILAAALANPTLIGFTALGVITLLLAGWRILASERLGWLLLFGLVAGFTELFADWVHVAHFGSLVYTHYFGFRLLESPA